MKHPRPRVVLSLTTLLFLLIGVPARRWSQERPTTVIVVRHAERAAVEGQDPPLSEAGEQRARALIEAVGDAGVRAIYATQFQRT